MTPQEHQQDDKQHGFTIIEVVLMIFITSVLLLGMLSLFDWHNKIYYLEQAEVQATGSARTVLVHLDEHIIQAYRVLDSHDFNGTVHTTGSGVIVVQLPTINNDTIVPNTYDYVAYYTTGTNLYEVIQADAGSQRHSATKQLSSTVSNLNFTYDDATYSNVRKVTVDLQTSTMVRTSTVSAHLSQTMVLRNR